MHGLLCPRPLSTRTSWKLHAKKWKRQGSTWRSQAWRWVRLAEKVSQYNGLFTSGLALKYLVVFLGEWVAIMALLTRISGTEWAFSLLLLYWRHLERTATIHCHICHHGFAALSLPLHMLMTWFQSHFGSEFPVLCNQMENQWVPKVSSISKMSWINEQILWLSVPQPDGSWFLSTRFHLTAISMLELAPVYKGSTTFSHLNTVLFQLLD